MSTLDRRVDAYIAKAKPFARPVLLEIRKRVHAAAPDLDESIKWGFPFFLRDGKIIATMSGFTAHCRFGVWRWHDEAPAPTFTRLTSVSQVPSVKDLTRMLRAAVAKRIARESRVAASPKKKIAAKIAVPADLSAALKKTAKAAAAFKAFSPSQRNEYSEWVSSAKRPKTRAERIATAALWIAQGKTRYWKYQ